MSYQVLYRAWRPATFSEVVGQDATVQTLRRQVLSGRIAHAYLFCGTRGTGKTTASKILARAINCLTPKDGDPCGECECCRAILAENCMDVQEIDAASNNGVDEIRDLREKIRFPPTMTRYKVYIIDEVHMLSSGAFNALLKTLEEPPEHAVFILATTEPQKLPATILSRCQRFDFHRISIETIVGRLKTVLNGIGREAEEDALTEIARAAEGGMRDALSLLDCCLSYTDGAVSLALARDVLGTTGRAFLFDFCDALLTFDAGKALLLIDEMMNRGADPIVFSRDVTAHLRALLLARAVGDVSGLVEVTPEDAQHINEQAKTAGDAQLMRITELFMRVESESKWFSRPRTMLELMTVRACHPEQEEEASVHERLDRMEKLLESGAMVRTATRSPALSAPKPSSKPALPKTSADPALGKLPDPPQEFLDGKAAFAENPGMAKVMESLKFAGFDGSIVQVIFPKDMFMMKGVFERRIKDFSAVLSQTFGTEVMVRIVTAPQSTGSDAQKMSATVKKTIETAQDIFPRDKIELVD